MKFKYGDIIIIRKLGSGTSLGVNIDDKGKVLRHKYEGIYEVDILGSGLKSVSVRHMDFFTGDIDNNKFKKNKKGYI